MATILVVDDVPINRQFLVTLLRYSGHRMLEAADGDQALEVVRRERPGLVIADILMPKMDGYELVRQMRADTAIADIPVIFYTATYKAPRARELARACGVFRVLSKPADPEVILEAVDAALGPATHATPPPPPVTITGPEFDREHLQILTDKLAEKVTTLEMLNLRLGQIVTALGDLASAKDLQRLLDRFCAAAREIVGAGFAAAGILDEGGEALRCFAASAPDAEAPASVAAPRARHGVLGTVLAKRRPISLRATDTQAIDLPPAPTPVRSFLGVPIASPQQVYGWLYLTDRIGADEFTEEDERLLVTFATDVALVYENLKLFGEIAEARDQLKYLFESLDRCFFSVDSRTGALIQISAACEKIYGHPAEAFFKNPQLWHDVIHPDDLAAADQSEARLIDGDPQTTQYRIRRPNGEIRWIETLAKPTLEGPRRIARLDGMISDITERKEMEDELARARDAALEASRLKSAFLANMSHEIRTPLNVIMGYVSVIDGYFGNLEDENIKSALGGIDRAGRRLIETVHGILDISKIETGTFDIQPQRLELRPMIEERIREFQAAAKEKGLSVTCDLGEPRAAVLFDEYCLSRALSNLLDNAVKFTAKGGVSVKLYRNGKGSLCIEVRDSGVGIDESYRRDLFNVFSQEESGYTRHFEGNGIGLALTKRFVELNGAGITVESEKGKGSVFTIRFSSAREVRAPGPTPAEATGAPAHELPLAAAQEERPTVLVVEDDLDTQMYLKMVLRDRYDVLSAASGTEFRRELNARPEKVRIILMDLSLKGSEDGLTLTRYIREHDPLRDVPIIITTAHALQRDRLRAREAGCNAFFEKPFDTEELLAKMENLISTR